MLEKLPTRKPEIWEFSLLYATRKRFRVMGFQ